MAQHAQRYHVSRRRAKRPASAITGPGFSQETSRKTTDMLKIIADPKHEA